MRSLSQAAAYMQRGQLASASSVAGIACVESQTYVSPALSRQPKLLCASSRFAVRKNRNALVHRVVLK